MNSRQYIESGVLELYVAGALTPQEVREVEHYAKNSTEIRAEIATIEATMENFAMANAVAPPPALKARVLDKISKTPAPHIPRSAAPAPAAPIAAPRTMATGGWLAAAMVGLVVTTLATVYFFNASQTATHDKAALVAQNEKLETNLTRFKANCSGQLALLMHPATHPVALMGLPKAPDAKVMVYWNNDMKETLLMVNRLPPPPDGMQYQLWALDNGKPIDAGMLGMSDDMQLMKAIGSAQAFAITLEKKGGSPTPTMDAMVVMGKV